MWRSSNFTRTKKGLTGLVTFSLFLQWTGSLFVYLALLVPLPVSAAEVVIDSSVSTAANSFNVSGSVTVFVSDTTGYVFYRDGSGRCVYSKTTDQGDTWGGAVIFDNQTDCLKVSVWYDRWTPGDDTGNFIHLGSMDSSSDDLFYNRLDTSSDTLLLASSVNATVNSGQTPTFTGNNTFAITKATDGDVYLTADDRSDAYVVSCASSCNLTTSWNEVGAAPLDAGEDHTLLAPLPGGDVMLLNRDVSTNDIRSAIWNGTTWSGWTVIDNNAVENSTYDGGFSVTVNKNNNDVYLAYVADHNNSTADHDVRTAIYDGTGWTAQTDVLTNVPGRGLHDVAIAVDENTDAVYVAYAIEDTIGTAASANVYYRVSTTSMSTWGAEQGPVSATAGDIYTPSLNLFDNERIFVAWYNNTTQTLYGDTIANIGPDTLVSAVGTALSEVRAGDTGVYLGGTFAIETLSSRTISSITVSESGTIDGQNELNNVALFYEIDATVPYDCVSESYSGSESQFGTTDLNGFSGPDGVSTFSGTIVGISPTQTLCLYTVTDVSGNATDGATINIEITDPPADVTVSGVSAFPATPIDITGSTTVVSASLNQTHYHWRNDDGSETDATSATAGIEDQPLGALPKSVPRRLRLQIANEGSTSSLSTDYALEYTTAATTCGDATGWSTVPSSGSVWEMFDSANLTDGDDTTNIATSTGGVFDENTVFLTPNAAVRDATSTVPSISLETNEFIELEYSIQAAASAVEGETYCFRVVTESGPLTSYSQYPEVTIAADMDVASLGTKTALIDIPTNDAYLGGVFSVVENSIGRTITGVTLSASGTADSQTDLDNVRLYYDVDTTAPYNCASESYNAGVDAQFGSGTTFPADNASTTITGSLVLSANNTACFYVVFDVTETAQNGETVDIFINSPTTDITVNTGSVGPSTPVGITGTTTLQGSILTQTHYHWRNDNGSEIGATSYTAGSEDTVVTDFALDTPIRLRLGISNEGATSSVPTTYSLEYGPKLTTCGDVSVWTNVDDAPDDAWDMFNSANLTDGSDTTDIAIADGGVSDENTSFQGVNAGVAELDATTGTSTLSQTEYLDLEFSITSTVNTPNETDFCFRVVANGVVLPQYDQYAEITTIAKRDFKIQRGTVVITGTATTVTAGVDYTAPASTSTAFVRITNTHNTGAGQIVGGGSQRTDEITAYVSDQSDITSSISFARSDANIDTYINWEIIEFIGLPGTDNEIIVRDVGTQALSNAQTSVSGPAVTGITDDNDVVVFVTGNKSDNTTRNLYSTQFTSEWATSTSQPTFRRGATGAAAADVSYAVVEFVGLNWSIQRVEHAFAAAGVTEVESITPIGSLERAFLHTQKRTGADPTVANFGHTAWLSSIGLISFELDGSANTGVEHTSVVWVIENTQVGLGAMSVQRLNGATTGGVEPIELSLAIPVQLSAMNNTSLYGNSRAGGTNSAHPRAVAGLLLTSVDTLQLWRSDGGTQLDYRIEVVEWPVASFAARQNYYRFYTDNNQLTPSDPWPAGGTDLGENTSISVTDDPPGEGEVIRLRMSVRVSNANLSPGVQDFKLQYAERVGTCSAIDDWFDLGDTASTTQWRGFAATGTSDGTALASDPPLGGELLLSVSDVGGTLEQENPSSANPYAVSDGEDIEYDWYLEHNGANPNSVYCFRMSRLDLPLDGYFNYPSIRTAGFSPVTQDWRWYGDPENETPSAPEAATNVAPINIANNETLTLRVTVDETKNVVGTDAKFRLQYSEYPDFSQLVDIVATTTCVSSSLWCYAEGPVADNTTITTALLGDGDGCTSGTGNGCGTHNSNPAYTTGHTHGASRAQEYSFTIRSTSPRVNATYYFRLVDAATGLPAPVASGESYPSLVTEGSSVDFTLTGLPSGTTTAGVVTDVVTTPTEIAFGTLTVGVEQIAAQRLSVSTNATEGYQVFKFARSQFIDSYGNAITPLAASNTSPGSWPALCDTAVASCFGYHTTDATLSGNSTRFSAFDTYAGIHTELEEIMFSSIATSSTEDVVYRVAVTELQPAGQYETDIVYVVVPVF